MVNRGLAVALVLVVGVYVFNFGGFRDNVNQATQQFQPNPNVVTQQTATLKSLAASQFSPAPLGLGYVAVGVTDPPTLGRYLNITSLIVSVSGLQLHRVSDDSWISVPISMSQVDLVKATNLEQLIAATPIPEGQYNIVRFNIDSALATISSPMTCQTGLGPSLGPPCSQPTIVGPSISLSVPSGGIQITIAGGGVTVQNGRMVHIVIDVRINEPATAAGRLTPAAWTARDVSQQTP